jgi:hypothetical protein
MAPPWVTFDSIAYYNGSCANGADPDIASLGVRAHMHIQLLHTTGLADVKQVVLSFILASIMTTSASVLAMILDQAFDSKGHFTLRAPIRFVRERFLDTEWKRDYAWRLFLDPLIIGFGDQQLVTGYAVLLSG